MAEARISVEHVSKRFRIPHRAPTLKHRLLHPFDRTSWDELQALDDVSFEVEDGEFFGIVGRNGCGKSTLLKILAGIYHPDSGDVRVAGALAPFIELGVGFNPELSARDNVKLNGTLLGFTRRELAERYDDIVAFAELERFMDLKLRNFSSGMIVRLAFSVAVHANADVMLVDEVLAVGDESFQRKCYDVFRRRKANGQTVVFVSHDMHAVEEFCSRAILIHDGKLVLEGDPRQVSRGYRALNEGDDAARVIERTEGFGQDAVLVEADVQREIESGDHLQVRARWRCLRATDDPIASIGIVDRFGTRVFRTNTLWRDAPLPQLKAGDEVEVTFEFDCPLAAGTYDVNLGLAEDRGRRVLGIADAAQSFSVRAEVVTESVLDVPATITSRVERARERAAHD